MASLARAVALSQPHGIAVTIREDLHLDMAWPHEIALRVDLAVPEVRLRLALGRFQRLCRLVGVVDDFHAAPATAEGCLYGNWPAVGLPEVDDLAGIGDRLAFPRDAGDPGASGSDAGIDLVAHCLDRLGRWPDEGRARRGYRSGEGGVLGEEPVSGMHCLRTGSCDHVQDELGRQVALGGGLAAQCVGLVGQTDMERVLVELGVDGDRGNAELATSPDDPHGNLAAVRDEHLVEHGSASST